MYLNYIKNGTDILIQSIFYIFRKTHKAYISTLKVSLRVITKRVKEMRLKRTVKT